MICQGRRNYEIHRGMHPWHGQDDILNMLESILDLAGVKIVHMALIYTHSLLSVLTFLL